MNLKDILESNSYEIIKINHSSKIFEAIKLMKEKNVSGIFVVDDEDKLVSIFTERDIVHCIYDNIPLSETLENIVRKDITVFDPITPLSTAISIALRKKIRHLPVVEKGQIIGMVTFRDLVTHLLPEVCYIAETMY